MEKFDPSRGFDIGAGSVAYRLMDVLGPFGFLAIKDGSVNLDDLLCNRQVGKIVRCYENPADCIRIYAYPQTEPITDCIAGWISEDV